MGQEQKKYYIADNGDILKVNDDGSFTEIGNVAKFEKYEPCDSAQGNNTLIPNNHRNKLYICLLGDYNWLYVLSFISLIIASILCICKECYRDSQILGMLSLCAGTTAVLIPWIFKNISKFFWIVLLLFFMAGLITIIAFSYEWLYVSQIGLSFISLVSWAIAYFLKRK